MENFFVEDNFYSDLIEYCERMGWEKKDVELLPDDYSLTVSLTNIEPVQTITAEWIAERIDQERFSKDGYEMEIGRIINILNRNIDFDNLNSEMPYLCYTNGKKERITKADLLENL